MDHASDIEAQALEGEARIAAAEQAVAQDDEAAQAAQAEFETTGDRCAWDDSQFLAAQARRTRALLAQARIDAQPRFDDRTRARNQAAYDRNRAVAGSYVETRDLLVREAERNHEALRATLDKLRGLVIAQNEAGRELSRLGAILRLPGGSSYSDHDWRGRLRHLLAQHLPERPISNDLLYGDGDQHTIPQLG